MANKFKHFPTPSNRLKHFAANSFEPPISQFILDQIPLTAGVAYSLRLLRASYTGPCLKVRRAIDNATSDIYFDNNYVISQRELVVFCQGSSAYVEIWYDQSGNGRNLVQASFASQPLVFNGTQLIFNSDIPYVGSGTMSSSSFNTNTDGYFMTRFGFQYGDTTYLGHGNGGTLGFNIITRGIANLEILHGGIAWLSPPIDIPGFGLIQMYKLSTGSNTAVIYSNDQATNSGVNSYNSGSVGFLYFMPVSGSCCTEIILYNNQGLNYRNLIRNNINGFKYKTT